MAIEALNFPVLHSKCVLLLCLALFCLARGTLFRPTRHPSSLILFLDKLLSALLSYRRTTYDQEDTVTMAVSMGVFCPQSRAPSQSYLESIQSFISNHHVLQCIVQNIPTLLDVWSILAEKKPGIARLSQGPRYAKLLTQWLVDGASDTVASTSSGIVALTRLVIIQITQYFQFLESRDMTHADFIAQVRDAGGIQGYCGGLPAAVALACSKSEQDLIQSVCTAIRLAYAIGVYAELGDDSDIPGTTTIVVRLKREGQAEELVRMFPNASPHLHR
jgi:hypothetical protein